MSGDALLALRCLDLTSLNDSDTDAVIDALCARAQTPFGGTAAVCVYPQFVTLAAKNLAEADIKIATVLNFPHGTGTVAQTDADTRHAILLGAGEVDIVFDYTAFLRGDVAAFDTVKTCITAAHELDATVKVIVESAAFDDMHKLRAACDTIADMGPDFLKTSTGKHARGGATPDAAKILSQAAARAGCGVKISGGVRTVADCIQYMAIARDAGLVVAPDVFRFGASGVLDALLHELGGADPSASTPILPTSSY